jgi:hypothetical protein
MQRSPVMIGTLTAALAFVIVWALAAGFDVDPIQALSRSLPLILVGGVVTSLATAIARHELA